MTAHSRAPDAINLGATEISVSDFASQGNAILGIRDSGKTYTATYLAEQLLVRDIPFVAIDPIGVWRMLRHKGKHRDGFDVLVAGGAGGDVPLTVKTAVPIVDHALVNNLPLILDLYDIRMSKAQWRQIVGDVVRFLLYENRERGKLRHVFIEEAAEFVPQLVRGEHGECYAEIEKLARMGGNSMLGLTLINQRAEQVNKAVLELCDCLFLHRQKGRLSLTALTKWLDFGDKKHTSKIIDSLPTLAQGKCWVWKQGESIPLLTQIPAKATFVPNRREETAAGKPVPVPHMLKGLNVNDAIDTPTKVNPPAPAKTVNDAIDTPEPVQVPVFREGEIVKLETMRKQLDEALAVAEDVSGSLQIAVRELKECLQRADTLGRPRYVAPPAKRQPNGAPTTKAKGPRQILSVLAMRYPGRVTMGQLGVLAGFTQSTLRTYLPELNEAGFIDKNADGMSLTDAGRKEIGSDFERMPKGGEPLLKFWMSKLDGGEGKILETLYSIQPRAATMESLAEMTGYTPSTLRTYLPTLRRNKLIASDELRIAQEFVQ